MCGIAGVLRLDGRPVAAEQMQAMADVMAHRGPDSDGVWTNGPIGLSHRRLAIIDLSAAANQPMANETGQVLLVYNGETYNFRTLRSELEGAGHVFHSKSDTEVIIHAYEEWGKECVSRLNGHFAFGLWDTEERTLLLARDRFGVKPLYYYLDGTKLVFASEIKAILRHAEISAQVCYEGLNEYFTFQNIVSDRTLFKGIRLLPPGTLLTVDPAGGVSQSSYWDYSDVKRMDTVDQLEAAEEVSRLFEQAVTRQLMSDVPVGSYLSGGLDSSSIAAIARQKLGRICTFTMGFDLSSASGMERGFDERPQAEALANRLKTEHYEMVLHAGDMEHVMPELIWHLEDLRVGQCYPNYYVARLAGKFVKVVLSGGGGDELFGGYPWRYHVGLEASSAADYQREFYGFWQRLVPDSEKASLFNEQTYRRTEHHSTFEVFTGLIEGGGFDLSTRRARVEAALYFDQKVFLNGLLVVEDKLNMAHSLEARTPFLDNDLAEFAVALPVETMVASLEHSIMPIREDSLEGDRQDWHRDDGKVILRRAMKGWVPTEIAERRKQGFSAPDASWFRGESIEYIRSLLGNPQARIFDYLGYEFVNRTLAEHCDGQVNRRLLIWSLLSFEWWLRRFMP